MSSYFAIDRRAVFSFFNPVKSDQFMVNYFHTIESLRARDQHSLKCFRSIYLVLLLQTVLQVCLYLCPFRWHRLAFFDIIDESNNYPNILRLHFAAYAFMSAYLIHMLYFQVSSEQFLKLFYHYYIDGSKTFVSTPVARLNKSVLTILNAYQVLTLVTVVYMCAEYTVTTQRVFHDPSLQLWAQWIEFVSMSCFFVAFAAASFLFVFISNTFLACAVLCFEFIFYRFRETYQPLALSYCRFTTLRLLRFVDRNVGTMQYIFSINRIYGPMLFAFLLVNLLLNGIIAIYLMQSLFPPKQTVIMVAVFLGQLSYFFGMHFVVAVFSKRIHSPYKRMMSLNILIRRCPLRARIRLANTIQTFHIKRNKYGITYGAGKWALGLVTMMSFTKFIHVYGELLMYQYANI